MKIAFVCHGNICRSPMAEFVFKDMIKKQGLLKDLTVLSFATSDEEIWCGRGSPIHRGTIGIFKKHNIPYDEGKRAVQLTKSDYEKFDLFIGMDFANVRNMHRIFGSDPENKIKLLLEYANEQGEVADPWYTGNFDVTYSDIVRGCVGLLRSINEI